jgi:glycosyltransferase involved in cell wall biosynthesis
MRILVLPRDPNPYQGLLYREMQRLGVQVTYIGELTPSKTLNLLLLPLEVAMRRITGARLIHLHWVFFFAFPGAGRFPAIRQAAHIWFLIWLRTCHFLGMRLVWTAHNVLPHRPVFPDDVSARRALVQASDLVLSHSQAALAELAALGAVARRSAVIEHGPIAPISNIASLRIPGADGKARQFLFLGRVQEYKGVDDLLTAFAAIPAYIDASLTVAGQCDDPALRSRLYELAEKSGARVVLRLEYIPEKEVTQLLAATDVVVLPFRRVTTSGSAILALSHGRPLIVPDLAGLVDLPDTAVLRYEGGIPALIAALARLARANDQTLAMMSAASFSYVTRVTWQGIAERTMTEMLSVLGDITEADLCQIPIGIPHGPGLDGAAVKLSGAGPPKSATTIWLAGSSLMLRVASVARQRAPRAETSQVYPSARALDPERPQNPDIEHAVRLSLHECR